MFGSRGVRFDVYTQGDNRIFDIELQTANEGDLPKRARYYQGVIDVDNLPEGVDQWISEVTEKDERIFRLGERKKFWFRVSICEALVIAAGAYIMYATNK